jgi:hypothetical protein
MGISAKTTLVLTALALMAPAPALAADIREQPADIARTQVARVEWTGDSATDVVVERRYGLWWVVAANITPEREDDGDWSARWQPGRDAPSGTHRIRIEAAGETLLSDEFEVRPCECVLANGLRWRWRDGRFRLRLTAEYAPAGVGEFKLPADAVRTGRPVARVLREGRRIGSVRLRYRRGGFRGTWAGSRGPRASVVFRLVSLTDGFGNS